MNHRSIIYLSMLAMVCAAPAWAEDTCPAGEEAGEVFLFRLGSELPLSVEEKKDVRLYLEELVRTGASQPYVWPEHHRAPGVTHEQLFLPVVQNTDDKWGFDIILTGDETLVFNLWPPDEDGCLPEYILTPDQIRVIEAMLHAPLLEPVEKDEEEP